MRKRQTWYETRARARAMNIPSLIYCQPQDAFT